MRSHTHTRSHARVHARTHSAQHRHCSVHSARTHQNALQATNAPVPTLPYLLHAPSDPRRSNRFYGYVPIDRRCDPCYSRASCACAHPHIRVPCALARTQARTPVWGNWRSSGPAPTSQNCDMKFGPHRIVLQIYNSAHSVLGLRWSLASWHRSILPQPRSCIARIQVLPCTLLAYIALRTLGPQ